MSLFKEHMGPTKLWDRRTCSSGTFAEKRFPTSKLVSPTVRDQLFSRKTVPDQQAGQSYGGSDELI